MIDEILTEVMPILIELSVLLITIVLTILSKRASEWLKANTSLSQRAIIRTAAQDIVLFIEQVGDIRGLDNNPAKKEYAVNQLLQDIGELGIAISRKEADKYIEAAVQEVTFSSVELVEGEFAKE